MLLAKRPNLAPRSSHVTQAESVGLPSASLNTPLLQSPDNFELACR
jgi:hypothetical protein